MGQSGTKRPPTMQDVARLAGVSRVTASVALNGSRSNTHLSESTRQRIFAAAKQLNYTPNANAMALRSSRSGVIGYYVGYEECNMYDPFNAAMITGLRRSAQNHRQDLLIYSGFERGTADETYSALTNGKIDGLIVLPSSRNPIVDRLVDSYLPVVAIANRIESVPSVVVDDVGGSRLIAEYLAEHGHRQIVYFGDHLDHASTRHRLEAFVEAAEQLGLLVQVVRHTLLDPKVVVAHYLNLPPAERPTAAVCWADSFTYFFLEHCRQYGIRVPNDLAVVGFDGVMPRIRPVYQLTTVRAPWEKAAEIAVDTLHRLIEGEEVPQQTVLPVELVVGETA